MCLTLPKVLVTIMGIEKVLPAWQDLEVFLQLLPRSSTAERMNPYTSLWTGVRDGDGPQEFHLVLLDGGRTDVLADEVGRAALHCIRCSACLNVCPVYERVGGQAYESVYPGPIGAILTPLLNGLDEAPSLPWASSLCGACYEVCPVKIDIPSILVHLRGRVVREEKSKLTPEALAMKGDGRGVRLAPPLRGRAAAGAARPRPAGQGRRPGLDRDARPPGAAQGDVPRLVADREPRRRRRDDVDAAATARRRRAPPRRTSSPASAPRSGPRRPSPTSRAHTAPPARSPPTASSTSSASASPSTARPSTASPPPTSPRPSRRILARRRARRRPARASPSSADGRRRRRSAIAELDTLDAVVTGSALAIADTGTIVLDSGPALRPPRAHARARPPRLHRRGRARSSPSVPDAVAAAGRGRRRRAARSRSSPARPPPPTSSSTASRASTARACSTSSSSALEPARRSRPGVSSSGSDVVERPETESLNSRRPWPRERPAAGSRLGPSTSRAITSTMTSSMGPMLGIEVCAFFVGETA